MAASFVQGQTAGDQLTRASPSITSNMKTITIQADQDQAAQAPAALRYFLTYRGVKLPLCLTEELPADALRHRNTYFQAAYDEAGQML
jgi:hypothetical protein